MFTAEICVALDRVSEAQLWLKQYENVKKTTLQLPDRKLRSHMLNKLYNNSLRMRIEKIL